MTLLGGQTAGRSSLGNCHNFLGAAGENFQQPRRAVQDAVTMRLPSGLNAAVSGDLLIIVKSACPRPVRLRRDRQATCWILYFGDKLLHDARAAAGIAT